ncbi:glucose 1-dehydrogenase [Desulfuribacillus alkaliarsenatis]|uniref:3-ketoacyl-ACP reductase n=1 Tax=Desulfuribacillus alkaliarsenatis TaxID=766136 RepID=A0A1E5FZP8_9FIRM|nr:glucose 1-dehydrogenase [Desulfuribacillus alkaliarsenatis]OEF95716.1 hypothetical protein BHF68_11460 [Desulfuribacillus alkaliarsenatis]
MGHKDFKDEVVIVTGAGKGIGKEIAFTYAEHGAWVVIADKDIESARAVEESIIAKGQKAVFIETDVSREESVRALIGEVKTKYSRINILINNAGISKCCSPYELRLDDWDNIINTNLRSVYLCTREAATVMKNNGGGCVVNIASTRALMSEPNTEAYAASKGGIIALTHALAASLANDNIRVNAISPGWIETEDYESLREIDHSQHFSKRVGKPSDIARACLYLTEAGNEFVTGTNIVIDGGMTKKMIYEA